MARNEMHIVFNPDKVGRSDGELSLFCKIK